MSKELNKAYAKKNSTYEEMKHALESFVKLLVDHPEEVEIRGGGDSLGTYVFEVHVAQGEVGKVLGREGRIANALRQVLISIGSKNGVRCILDVVRQ